MTFKIQNFNDNILIAKISEKQRQISKFINIIFTEYLSNFGKIKNTSYLP